MSSIVEAVRDEKKLTISISIDGMKTEEINDLLSFIEAELIVRCSKMTEEQAFEIGEEITASWWRENKDRILRMISENE
jgi:hypothetical protein